MKWLCVNCREIRHVDEAAYWPLADLLLPDDEPELVFDACWWCGALLVDDDTPAWLTTWTLPGHDLATVAGFDGAYDDSHAFGKRGYRF
jgi:hypothetical protein